MSAAKERNELRKISCPNESLCVVLGSYSYLVRSYGHLNSGENMKARLVRLCCDSPYKRLKFE